MIQAAHWSQVQDWPSEHFSAEELACRGTGKLCIDEDALRKLEALRELIGKPMLINSAYRSPEHNRRVGGAKESCHMRGIAFDVQMKNHDPERFEQLARSVGFTGFGYYPASGFMHIDTGRARTWGRKFPKRKSRFEPESRPKEKITQSGTVKGGVVAGGVTTGQVLQEGAVIKDKLEDAQYQFSSGDFFGIAVALIILAGIGYMLYRRWVDAGKPRLRDILRGVL